MGLTALTQRQYNQITIGSFLLLAALAFITLAVLTGNAAMVEQLDSLGRKHIDLDAASIWRLPEMLRVLRLPVGSLHLVYQAVFGMKAVKPTHISEHGGFPRMSAEDCNTGAPPQRPSLGHSKVGTPTAFSEPRGGGGAK